MRAADRGARSWRSRPGTSGRRRVASPTSSASRGPRLVRGAPRRSDVDAVYIPLPNHLHARVDDRAPPRPASTSCARSRWRSPPTTPRRMVDACEAAGVRLMEAFMYRHHPSWIAARRARRVRAGSAGSRPSRAGSRTTTTTRPTSATRSMRAAGRCRTSAATRSTCRGCCSAASRPVSRHRSGATRTRASTSLDERDPRVSGAGIATFTVLDPGSRRTSGSRSTAREGRISIGIPFNIPPDRPTRVFVIAGGEPPVAPGVEVLSSRRRIRTAPRPRRSRPRSSTATPTPVPPADAVANMRVIEPIFGGTGEAAGADRADVASGARRGPSTMHRHSSSPPSRSSPACCLGRRSSASGDARAGRARSAPLRRETPTAGVDHTYDGAFPTSPSVAAWPRSTATTTAGQDLYLGRRERAGRAVPQRERGRRRAPLRGRRRPVDGPDRRHRRLPDRHRRRRDRRPRRPPRRRERRCCAASATAGSSAANEALGFDGGDALTDGLQRDLGGIDTPADARLRQLRRRTTDARDPAIAAHRQRARPAGAGG